MRFCALKIEIAGISRKDHARKGRMQSVFIESKGQRARGVCSLWLTNKGIHIHIHNQFLGGGSAAKVLCASTVAVSRDRYH